MSDRRAELERKKQKLASLREEKERRRREKEARQASDLSPLRKPNKDVLVETDKLLASLDITTSVSLPSTQNVSKGESNGVTDHSSLPPFPQAVEEPKPSKKCVLSVVNVHQTNIYPQERVNYDKMTQTLSSNLDREVHSLDYYVLTYDDSSVSEDGDGSSLPSIDVPGHPHPKVVGLPNIKMVKPAKTPDHTTMANGSSPTTCKKVRELSEVEKKLLMRSEDFHYFLDRTSRIVERALYQDTDIFSDYTGTSEDQDGDDRSGMTLSLSRSFSDDVWSKNRCLTSFDWSMQFPELLLASYNQNEDLPQNPDGVCLIWNMKYKKTTPEYIFHCQSAVTSACFAKYHPNLVIGGTYSGQIVLWDNRSNKRTPVQRSPLSAVAHTHPVYSICMVGSENAHNLITVSTDGRCCSWSVDMLSAPQDTIELNQQKQSRIVAVTCMDFPSDEFNNFVVGSEDGVVYTACRHGNRSGIIDAFESHQGPVTGIDTHKAQGQSDFQDIFITSSFDWTLKLWSSKSKNPLYSFEHNSDYVFDVQWSPIHPAVFACVDGLGHLDLWNLNCDTELPAVVTAVVEGEPALNKVTWMPSGHHVAVGDSMGRIWVYDVGEQLANPKADEWAQFSRTLQDFHNQSIQNSDMFFQMSRTYSSDTVSLYT